MGPDCRTARLSKQTADRIDKALPYRTVICQGLAALARQCIGAPFPSRLSNRPTATEQTVLLQAVQHRVDRPLRKFESSGAAPLNFLNDRVAVRRPIPEGGEDNHVQMAFQHFPFHDSNLYLVSRGVNAIGEDRRFERRRAVDALIGAQTAQHLFGLTDIPMLGELSVLNTPDIDCSIAEAFSSGWKPAKCTTVGRCMSGACNNLVTGNDAILYLHTMVRRYNEQVLEELDLSREARRTSPRVLDIGLCEEFREGTGIVRVY